MSVNPFPNDPGLAVGPLKAVSARNIPLINGLQNFLSLTTPNDGNSHLVIVSTVWVTTTLETGGLCQTLATLNGVPTSLVSPPLPALKVGGEPAGSTNIGTNVVMADPNTPVIIQQTSALSAGATVLLQGAILIF